MGWKDDTYPEDSISFPLCIFCAQDHTRKELLNWQMQHLRDIDPKYFPVLLRNVYRYFEDEIKDLKLKLVETDE